MAQTTPILSQIWKVRSKKDPNW